MHDVALDRRPGIRAPIWNLKARVGRAPRWLRVLAHLNAKRARDCTNRISIQPKCRSSRTTGREPNVRPLDRRCILQRTS